MSDYEIIKKPTMIKIIIALSNGPKTLSGLARELGSNKPRLKRYLRMLEEMGIVEKDGHVYKLKRMPRIFSNSCNS